MSFHLLSKFYALVVLLPGLCLAASAQAQTRDSLASDSLTSGSLKVVELYTSQGCSSCPPADKILGDLADDPDVLALSFHVDYWDYIGWKDPLAIKVSSTRQRGFAERMNLRYVYTPQIIVDGFVEVIGSKQQEVRRCLVDAGKRQKVRLVQTGSVVTLPAADLQSPMDVWQIAFTRKSETNILRGENKGRKLTHHNSVRAVRHLGIWTGEARSLGLQDHPFEATAVIVQEQKSGPIRAAIVVK